MAPKRKKTALPDPETPTVTPIPPDKTLLQAGKESLRAAQEALTAQIAFVAAKLEGKRSKKEHDHDLSSHLAFLGEKQATYTREQRQIETHEKESARSLTPERADQLVVSYVLDLPTERLEAVLAGIEAGRAGKRVL